MAELAWDILSKAISAQVNFPEFKVPHVFAACFCDIKEENVLTKKTIRKTWNSNALYNEIKNEHDLSFAQVREMHNRLIQDPGNLNSLTDAERLKVHNIDSQGGNMEVGDIVIYEVNEGGGRKKVIEQKMGVRLGEEVWLAVFTANLSKEKIIVKVLQGREEVVAPVDTPVEFMYSTERVKEVEIEVDWYYQRLLDQDKNNEIINKDIFKGVAITRVSFEDLGVLDKAQKTWKEKIENCIRKKAKLYLEVDAHTKHSAEGQCKWILYCGGQERDENQFWKGGITGEDWIELLAETCSLSSDSIKQMAPHASKANIDKHLEGLKQACSDNEISTCLRKVHFLAQLFHESGSLLYTSEINASNEDYGGFKGRGLIQLTWKDNYEAYGRFVSEDFTSSLSNKEKLEKPPHAARSAGWFWEQRAALNQWADVNDFIYITFKVNGGFNGYNHRLEFVKRGFKNFMNNSVNGFDFKQSRAYSDLKACFGWGLWHDTDQSKKGCTYSSEQALVGYARFVELHDQQGGPIPNKNWYNHDKKKIRGLVDARVKALQAS